jgi:hypothetical protein
VAFTYLLAGKILNNDRPRLHTLPILIFAVLFRRHLPQALAFGEFCTPPPNPLAALLAGNCEKVRRRWVGFVRRLLLRLRRIFDCVPEISDEGCESRLELRADVILDWVGAP